LARSLAARAAPRALHATTIPAAHLDAIMDFIRHLQYI
jgi:hypothetical protein